VIAAVLDPPVAGRTAWRVLIAEDDVAAGERLERYLCGRGFRAGHVADGLAAWDALQRDAYDLLLTDLQMPGLDGLELIRRAHAHQPTLVIVVTTAFATIQGTVQALKLGAADYVPKPFALAQLESVLRRVLQTHRGNSAGPGLVGSGVVAPQLFLGRCDALREAVEVADRVAPGDTVVLLRGETGTGKELLAQRIHDRSARRTRPFVRFNCGTLVPSLADAQLFGSERGAYTSSVRDTTGVLESADGGTVFLDEIGELPLELQTRLLEFLQDRAYRRVGSPTVRRADVRLLFATHRPLEEMVRAESFRRDLYYRVRQVEIRLPPLRDRREDIPGLAHVILERIAAGPRRLSPAAAAFAQGYAWPGNIRELEQALIASTALSSGEEIGERELRRVLGMDGGAAAPAEMITADGMPPLDAPLEDVERWHIQRALKALGGNVSAVARALRIDRSTIYRKLPRE
jgi:DNA-binding NtrC family response regulator